jgi:hypothetical protein
MTAAVWVALVTGVLGFVIGVLNVFVSRARLKHEQEQFDTRLKHEREQFDTRLKHEREQFETRLKHEREQARLINPKTAAIDDQDLGAIQTIQGLLQDENYQERTFATIRYHLAGRTDEEIRQLLRSMGAIRTSPNPERWRLPKLSQ